MRRLSVLLASAFLFLSFLVASGQEVAYKVHTATSLTALIEDEDTDGDLNITVDDPHIAGTERGDKRFRLHTVDGTTIEVAGTYYLANLLQRKPDTTRRHSSHRAFLSLRPIASPGTSVSCTGMD
jgi:hypothetical protein